MSIFIQNTFQKNKHGFSKSISTGGRTKFRSNSDRRSKMKKWFFSKIQFFSLKDMIKRILLMTFSEYLRLSHRRVHTNKVFWLSYGTSKSGVSSLNIVIECLENFTAVFEKSFGAKMGDLQRQPNVQITQTLYMKIFWRLFRCHTNEKHIQMNPFYQSYSLSNHLDTYIWKYGYFLKIPKQHPKNITKC